ncbi:MAG: HAMP domain-containing sensor histidine kinase [Acidobacteriota bacterium]|nr:HAMP domain-containing sensor histidine kinase [Acidobacteriota bacterium]
MLLRNREVLRQAVASAAAVLLAALAARAWAGLEAGLATLACGGFVAATSTALTLWRYRRLSELSSRIDDVLAGGRDVSLDDMREGELSILASQLSKTLSRLQVANDELAAEKRSLADSLADISHQLRTPLTSLGLELALIRRDAPAGASLTHARDAERLLERVQWLVSSLLKLARLDAGVVRLETRTVDVARLAEASFAPLAISFDLADVGFSCEVGEGCSFEGDASWTREALSNVLKNCLEHTPAGGVVSLRAWEDALACRICVQDSGPGFAEEDLPRVFDRFYRGGQAGAASSEVNPAGVGIGLSLSRALVSAQGGSITARNAVDEDGHVAGARFDVTFFKLVV